MRKIVLRPSVLFLLFLPLLQGGTAFEACSTTSSNSETSSPCGRLTAIRRIPFADEHVDDEAFNALMANGESAIPCLIRNLTNEAAIDDPRADPTISDFRVGDLAHFLLVRITKVPFEEVLPADVKSQFKKEGVYAFFRYTELPIHRKQLQSRWRAWLKKQQSAHKPGKSSNVQANQK
jgi:hypothetical protein